MRIRLFIRKEGAKPELLRSFQMPAPPSIGDSVRIGGDLYLVAYVAWLFDENEVDVLLDRAEE